MHSYLSIFFIINFKETITNIFAILFVQLLENTSSQNESKMSKLIVEIFTTIMFVISISKYIEAPMIDIKFEVPADIVPKHG